MGESATQRRAFLFDTSRCIGCKTCEMACRTTYCLGETPSFRRVFEYTGGTWAQMDGGMHPEVFSYYVSVACNHCENPACVQVCPSGAIRKRNDGYVILDSTTCIGCKSCSYACPYGAPSYSAVFACMRKCDGCERRVKAGLNPICVDACPMRALEYGPFDEFLARMGAVRDVAPLPKSRFTDPSLVIIGNAKMKLPQRGNGKVSNLTEVCQ